MDADPPVVYEMWDTAPLALPPRSRFFHLAPIGVGTPAVESLTSYVARLAEAHHVRPRQLIACDILPLFGRPRLAEAPFPSLLQAFLRKESHTLNGTRTQACDLVRVLEALTGRRDLRFLTLLPWAEVLPCRQLQRTIRAYCPCCFAEWRRSGQIVYEPLLWTLTPITVCPRHQQRLQLACPAPDCRYAAPWLGARSRAGYCAHCERWLGSDRGEEGRTPLTKEELAVHAWIVDALGEVLAATPSLPAPPRREQLLRTLPRWLQSRPAGSRQAWARQVGVTTAPVANWEQGKTIPSLWALLQVCRHLGTAPLRVLTGTATDALSADPAPPLPRPVRERTACTDEALRQALEAILTTAEQPPPSLREAAHRVGRSEDTLRRRLPALCHAISERYLQHRKAQGRQTRQRLRDEVRRATYQIHAQGHYPSASRVAQLISQPGSLRGGVAKVAWEAALEELGWFEGKKSMAGSG